MPRRLGMGRNVPMSPAATNIPKREFQKAKPSEVRSPRDVVTIVAWLAIAAAVALVLAYLVFRLAFFR